MLGLTFYWILLSVVLTVFPTILLYTRATFDRPMRRWKIALCIIVGVVFMPILAPIYIFGSGE